MRLFAMLAVCMFVLAACGEELPPSPPNPGGFTGSAIVGLAPSWAAVAQGMRILPSPVSKGQTAVVSVAGFDTVYPKGFYYTKKTGAWKEFSLRGTVSGEWIAGTASGLISTNDLDEGKVYVIVYACQRFTDEWECNKNQWMLDEFTVGPAATVSAPASSELPAQVSTASVIINQTIPPFMVLGTLAVPDSFGSVSARRYDAKYRSGTGLEVLVYVFDFGSRAELEKGLDEQFAQVLEHGIVNHNGKKVAVFVDDQPHTMALWSSGNRIVYVDTFSASANKQIIDKYLELYPSDLES